MCGIIGYTGPLEADNILLNGLAGLEYRGYDSAGIAYFGNDSKIHLIKTVGKVAALKELVKQESDCSSHCGIGHTRWATHGVPNEINSHPHNSQNGKISVVVASKPGVYALERAKNAGIEGIVLARSDYENVDVYSEALENLLKEKHTDLIVLAGFMTITNEKFTKAFENKIINVHPALIPSFCGKGYYGLHVHEAALARGVKVSGATVHFVNEVCDGGPIILQKAVPVEQGDTPETLQRRIMEQAEWKILPQAVSLFCAGKLSVNGSIVTIKE